MVKFPLLEHLRREPHPAQRLRTEAPRFKIAEKNDPNVGFRFFQPLCVLIDLVVVQEGTDQVSNDKNKSDNTGP